LVDSTGAWTTVTFNTPGVSAIWIGPRNNDGTGVNGWWPSIDNVQFSVAASPVPEPTSLALFGIGACVAGFGAARRRRRDAKQEATA